MKSFTKLILIAMIMIGLSSCTSGEKQLPLRIGITTWPGFDIALYGQATDIFAKRGIEVEFVRFQNQSDSSRAVIRGHLDAAFASLWDITQVSPGQDNPVVIMVTNVSSGADGIVAQAGIQSVSDLRGKTVEAKLGTVNHLILLEALKLHQVDPMDIKIEDISNEKAVELMLAGTLDAAVLWDPILTETAEKIKGNVIFTTRELDSSVVDCLMSSTRTLGLKREALTRFLLAWFDIMHAVETKPQQVFAAVGNTLEESGDSFARDYAGLKKGDIAMNQRMFESRLSQVMPQLLALQKEDARHSRLSREDIQIDSSIVTEAIKRWQPN